jgi:hypothetical protein
MYFDKKRPLLANRGTGRNKRPCRCFLSWFEVRAQIDIFPANVCILCVFYNVSYDTQKGKTNWIFWLNFINVVHVKPVLNVFGFTSSSCYDETLYV